MAWRAIVLVIAAINIFIAVEDFFVVPFVEATNLKTIVIVRGHVVDEEKIAVADFTLKGVNRLVAVIDHHPMEMGGVVLLHFHRVFRLVDEVQIAAKTTDAVVLRESEKVPW